MAPATLTFQARDLAVATDAIKRNTPTKPLNPIYAGVLLTAAAGTGGQPGTMAALDVYDTEVFDQEEVACVYTGDTDLVILVSAFLLANVTKTLRGEVVMVPGDNNVILTSGRTRLTLPYLDHASYPELPKLPPPVGTVHPSDFDTAIRATAYATGSDEAQPALSTINLRHTPEGVVMTATDRYRAARTRVAYAQPSDNAADLSTLVPAKFLATNSKLGGDDEPVELLYSPSGNIFGLASSRSQRSSSTVALEHPNIDALFGNTYAAQTFSVTFVASALLDALARCSLISSPTPSVTLSVTPDADEGALGATITVVRRAEATGDTIEDAAYATVYRVAEGAELPPGPFEVSFNADYLGDALRACQNYGDEVTVAFGTTKTPAVVVPGNGGEGTEAPVVPNGVVHEHLVMPVRPI